METNEALSVRRLLELLHPDGPYHITAFSAATGRLRAVRTFDDAGAAETAAISMTKEKANVYCQLAELAPDHRDERSSKAVVIASRWVWSEVDIKSGVTIEQLAILKQQIREHLKGCKLPVPTITGDSGHGLWFLWRIPRTTDLGLVESINTDIREAIGAGPSGLWKADNVQNIDRIARLFGTTNWPTTKKLADGRIDKPLPAVILGYDETATVHPLDVFPRADEAKELEIDRSKIQRLTNVNDLDQWKVPDRLKVIIVQGHDPDNPKAGDNSRSAWLIDAVCNLMRSGVSDETIAAVILDPNFKVAESVLDKPDPVRYAERQISRAHDLVESRWLYTLNERFAVIHDLGGRCLVVEEVWDEALQRPRLAKITFDDFRNRFLNETESITVTNSKGNVVTKKVPVGKFWLEHPRRRQYKQLTLLPGQPEEIQVKDGSLALNLWRGWGVEAIPGDLHKRYLAHLFENVCNRNQDHFDYLVKWMARAIQRPAEPGQVAVVLRGCQGAGKGFMARSFGKLFGRHFLHATNAKHVVGDFNSHMRDCLLLFADECFAAGKKEHASAMKSLITEPTHLVEAKGVDAETMPNFLHIILSSNDDWVVTVDRDDRRYFVLDVSADHARDTSYFGAIARDLESGGYSHLLWHLQQVELGDFDVQTELPETLAKDDQKNFRALRDEQTRILYDFLNEGGTLPADACVKDGGLFIPTSALAEHLGISPVNAGRFLTAAGGSRHKPQVNGKDVPGFLMRLDLRVHQKRWQSSKPDFASLRWHQGSEWQIDSQDDLPF